MRLKEIARFTALASNPWSVISFTAYQIPHILPIAIPISSLIAAIILFQNLSKTHQLTALRTGGLSLFQISYPILVLGFLLSVGNFFITSEIAPLCRTKSKEFVTHATTLNPLVLLQRKDLLRIKNAYVDLHYKNSSYVKDLFFIVPNKVNKRLHCYHARSLTLQDHQLEGKNLSLIAYLEGSQEEDFDTLIVENQDIMATDANAISTFMKSFHWNLSLNFLPLKLLLAKHSLDSSKIIPGKTESIPSEIARRCSFAFSVFSFTFIGIVLGTDISRYPSKKKIMIAIFLALIILISLVIGKALKYYTLPSLISYLLPQPLALIGTAYYWKKITRGIE